MSATRPCARLAVPPTAICAMWRDASSAGIEWPKPFKRRSTSRRPLKKSRPARTESFSKRCVTNSSGDSAEISTSRRPSAERSSNLRRNPGSNGGDCASGRRIFSTIGLNSSASRRSASASRFENSAQDATVRSRSVHHSSARPSRRIMATFSFGSR